MRLALVTALAAMLAACGSSSADRSCSGPTTECQSLCEEYCSALLTCGVSPGDCLDRCRTSYKCPGETPGQDDAICRTERQSLMGRGCADNCRRSSAWSGCVVVDAAQEEAGASSSGNLDASE
jgi:hypothetical protein